MRKSLKLIGLLILLIIDLFLIIPLYIPIPPLENVRPVEELADPDSRFTHIDDINFHYKVSGCGEPAIVLLHGFGASLYSWREVMPVLAEGHSVFAYDRPAFGLTERPVIWTGENPYTQQASISHLNQLIDAWGLTRVVLIGNSAGGSTAMEFALVYPNRVDALILVSPATGGSRSLTTRFPYFINMPQTQRMGPLLVRRIANTGLETLDEAWHDPSRQPEDTIPLYTKPLQAENWDIALWHYSTAEKSDLHDHFEEFDLPILLITGDDDRLVPPENTIALQDQLAGSELVVIPDCGHVPQEECPGQFIEAVEDFLHRNTNSVGH